MMKRHDSRGWLMIFLKLTMIVGIFYYLLSGVDWSTFLVSLSGYALLPILFGIFLILFNDVIQALRWRYIAHHKCSLQASLESILVGGFLNVILPAKLGEVSRLLYLRNFYHFPLNYGLGAMVIERGADIFIMVCLLAIGAGIATGNDLLQMACIVFVAMIIGGIVALKRGNGITQALLRKIPSRFVRIYSKKIIRLILRDLGVERTLQVLGYTLALRIVYFLTFLFFIQEVASLNLSLGELFIIYLVSSIAWAIPLSPGGTGTFHAGLVMAMGWYGIGKEEGLAIAVVLHLLLNLVPMASALLIVLFKDISVSGMVRMEKRDKDVTLPVIIQKGD